MNFLGFGAKKEKPEEQNTGDNTSNFVYVASNDHSWVPGRLVETDGVEAKVSLPNYKDEQSLVSDGGRSARGSTQVTVKLSDYASGALPLQNVSEGGVLNEVEDMVE